jgi:hypothetical protein
MLNSIAWKEGQDSSRVLSVARRQYKSAPYLMIFEPVHFACTLLAIKLVRLLKYVKKEGWRMYK